MQRGLVLIIACLLGLPGAFAVTAPTANAAPATQPLPAIVAAARARLESEAARRWGPDPAAETEIAVGRLDPRLRLPACMTELETSLPTGARALGAVAVGVRCPSPAWSVFVPGTIKVRKPVLVTAVSLPRGALLAASDLVLELRDLSSLPAGYLSDPAAVAGRTLRRPLQAGTVLLPGMAALPKLVTRGERVALQAGGGRIAVQVEGEALADGALGETVRVRNLATRRVVQGTVGGPQLVVVGSPGMTENVNQP